LHEDSIVAVLGRALRAAAGVLLFMLFLLLVVGTFFSAGAFGAIQLSPVLMHLFQSIFHSHLQLFTTVKRETGTQLCKVRRIGMLFLASYMMCQCH
jgi:hypothetical protein